MSDHNQLVKAKSISTKNCDLSKEDVMACQKISDTGYRIEYRIVPDSTLVTYADVKDKLKQAFL